MTLGISVFLDTTELLRKDSREGKLRHKATRKI